MVSVDVKHHVYLLYRFFSFLLKAGSFETLFSIFTATTEGYVRRLRATMYPITCGSTSFRPVVLNPLTATGYWDHCWYVRYTCLTPSCLRRGSGGDRGSGRWEEGGGRRGVGGGRREVGGGRKEKHT